MRAGADSYAGSSCPKLSCIIALFRRNGNRTGKKLQLLFVRKKRDDDCARADVRAEGAADGGDRKRLQLPFPNLPAGRDIFLKRCVARAGVAEHQRLGKINAAARCNRFVQEIVALLCASGLSKDGELPISDGQDWLDIEKCPRNRARFREPAAAV